MLSCFWRPVLLKGLDGCPLCTIGVVVDCDCGCVVDGAAKRGVEMNWRGCVCEGVVDPPSSVPGRLESRNRDGAGVDGGGIGIGTHQKEV
ncbi:hypothetical protein PspLS_09079 [Pyricularia sp. CBS 133598]|nr:hypothetical protein PspLS_09079 [Pyricularia sp. CBS 133598]